MNKLVYSVFKAIAMSIIFIFVFDLVFFMYRVSALNSRMESISTSMRKVVMENNYLPPEVASNYQKLFQHMICDFNNVTYHDGMTDAELVGAGWQSNNAGGGATGSVNSAAFIAGFRWNYKSPSTAALSIPTNRMIWQGSGWQPVTNVELVKRQMNQPANYGDIMVMEMKVVVFQPIWGWTQADGRYNYNSGTPDRSINGWVRSAATTTLTYTYYVPCLNFRTITSG